METAVFPNYKLKGKLSKGFLRLVKET